MSDSEIAGHHVAQRGVKRKVDGSPALETLSAGTAGPTLDSDVNAPRRIQALSQDVVNKIAAGEIIVAPAHALKELLENAVDAGATQLEIVVKDGGLKLLQITDNGCGIHVSLSLYIVLTPIAHYYLKEDLPLLCERFTTSKLKKFEDLTEIGTYGFRGEALASISHIAHLAVTTRTHDSSCAWKSHYSDGKLVAPKPNQSADPKATAGRQGTQITVEDLFYNVPTRRRAFRSTSEEYTKILDLVSRYSIHCDGVSFSCKKHGESGMALSVPANASTMDRIRQIHGSAVSNELLEFTCTSERWGFTSKGWISNANYSVKKTSFILFINHRSVESANIKKALEQTYATFLPKGGHPFIYLALDIEPHRLDVNVHPTKREVHFLHEDEIIESICDEARTALGNVDTSRTFMTQTLLPNARLIPTTSIGKSGGTPATPAHKSVGNSATPGSTSYNVRNSATASSSKKFSRPYDNDLVRTDARERKITSMLTPRLSVNSISMRDDMEYEIVDKEATICRLKSIKELRAEVRDLMHIGATDIFAGHTFVGIVDPRRRIVAIQFGVKLYLVDHGMVCNEYFYQLGLTDFGNFGTIKFDPPLDLTELLNIGVEQERSLLDLEEAEANDWDEIVEMVKARLVERRDMLAECFSMLISEEGKLEGIPLLMNGYMPPLVKLPNFLLRLGPFVVWDEEKPCFHSFIRELASFYVPECLPLASVPRNQGPPPPAKGDTDADGDLTMGSTGVDAADENPEQSKRRAHVYRALEHIMFPALKVRFVATKAMLKGVVEVADLKGLYRVFERC
ncbi:DNA mismatch repair protein MutL [Microthyrium microscopicum]|uniref:DNA mismatch repair protein MutL n=1 Tax=Microthyrium microscopicum TaxID=703497 RepID=A0A6A6UH31_9PEZI|nr:DNA mismatch repair protein MutL [Microthyrium microscopicum]